MEHIDALADALLSTLPKHEISLNIEHNPHKTYYEKLADYIRQVSLDEPDDWTYEGEKEKAIENDEIWILTYFPDTPVGHIKVAASNLSNLLKWAAEVRCGR
jgi:hypothetical protein